MYTKIKMKTILTIKNQSYKYDMYLHSSEAYVTLFIIQQKTE